MNIEAYQLAERFGWTLEYVRSLDAVEVAQIKGYMDGMARVAKHPPKK